MRHNINDRCVCHHLDNEATQSWVEAKARRAAFAKEERTFWQMVAIVLMIVLFIGAWIFNGGNS